MDALDRVVAGLSCRAVLHALSSWLDGELEPERVSAIGAHLAACDTCARFGGRVTAAVEALRAMPPAADPPPAALRRIRAAIGAR